MVISAAILFRWGRIYLEVISLSRVRNNTSFYVCWGNLARMWLLMDDRLAIEILTAKFKVVKYILLLYRGGCQ